MAVLKKDTEVLEKAIKELEAKGALRRMHLVLVHRPRSAFIEIRKKISKEERLLGTRRVGRIHRYYKSFYVDFDDPIEEIQNAVDDIRVSTEG